MTSTPPPPPTTPSRSVLATTDSDPMPPGATLTVLGCRAGSPDAGSPASGYLLRAGDTTVLLDCGPGTVSAAAARTDMAALDAVVISHQHADHAADLVALAYHRTFPERLPPLPLLAPLGFAGVMAGLDAVWGIPTLAELRRPLTDAFDLAEVRPGATTEVAGLALQTEPGVHPVPVLCTRWPDVGLAYTADTGYSEGLVRWAADVPVLLAEATYVESTARDLDGHGHLTGTLAGRLAAAAGAGRLVLTHFADRSRAAEAAAEARAVFTGPIATARPGLAIPLAGSLPSGTPRVPSAPD